MFRGESIANSDTDPCCVEVIDTPKFGPRIRKALLDHASQISRPYSDKEFGREVGKLARGKAYGGSTVGEWIAGRNEPTLAVFMAMSAVTGKPVLWLMGIDEPVVQLDETERVTEMPEITEELVSPAPTSESAAGQTGTRPQGGREGKRRHG